MRLKIYVLILLFLFLSPILLAQESLTITTYYPSPYGVYQNLRLYPTDDFSPGSTCSYEGEMFYHNSTNKVYVCKGGIWQFEAVEDLWIQEDIRLYSRDFNWNVGIGTDNPLGKLHVKGPNDTAGIVAFMPGSDTAAAGTPDLRVRIGKVDSTIPDYTNAANATLKINGVITRQGTNRAYWWTGYTWVRSQFAQIGLGVDSYIGGGYNTIGGGYKNIISHNFLNEPKYATIRGGVENAVHEPNTVIGGGFQNNIAQGVTSSIIGGGYNNTIQVGGSQTISGGYNNTMPTVTGFGQNSGLSVIAGGYGNRITSYDENTVVGGRDNAAGCGGSWSGGRRAKSGTDNINFGSNFVWADSQDADYFGRKSKFVCPFWSVGHTFNVRASEGTYFNAPAIYFNGTKVHPADIAEFMSVLPSENIKETEIVSLVGNDLLGKSKKPYDENLMGVVSSKRTITFFMGSSQGNRLPIALAGKCYVKVTKETGPIKLGDPITSSSRPGMGMKATKSGKIIGYALEEVDFKDKPIKEILVFVKVGYFNADGFVSQAEHHKLLDKLEGLKKRLKAIKTASNN